MKRMKNVVLVILAVVIIVGIVLGFNLLNTAEKKDSCTELKNSLDKQVGVNGNIYGSGIVGGTLINASGPTYFIPEDESQNMTTYILTFNGANKEGVLYLRTSSNLSFSYQLGKFYMFDLAHLRLNGMLSGAYLDQNMTALELVTC